MIITVVHKIHLKNGQNVTRWQGKLLETIVQGISSGCLLLGARFFQKFNQLPFHKFRANLNVSLSNCLKLQNSIPIFDTRMQLVIPKNVFLKYGIFGVYLSLSWSRTSDAYMYKNT